MPILLRDIRRPAIRLQGDRDVQLLRFVARCRLIFDDEDAILTDVIHSQRRHQLLPFIENLIYYFLKFLKNIYIYIHVEIKGEIKINREGKLLISPAAHMCFLLKYIFFFYDGFVFISFTLACYCFCLLDLLPGM